MIKELHITKKIILKTKQIKTKCERWTTLRGKSVIKNLSLIYRSSFVLNSYFDHFFMKRFAN